jgi:hemolysin activation/secretion protein
MLRCSVFTDYGSTYLIDRASTANLSYSQWGAGAGFFLTAGEHFYARLTVAWALQSTVITPTGSAQAYFAVGCQF